MSWQTEGFPNQEDISHILHVREGKREQPVFTSTVDKQKVVVMSECRV